MADYEEETETSESSDTEEERTHKPGVHNLDVFIFIYQYESIFRQSYDFHTNYVGI